MSDQKQQNDYWATRDSVALISELASKVSDFDRHIDMSGRWLTARDLYYNYYLVNEQNYLFPNYGADGFKRLNVNHFRAILKHLLSLVTAQRVSPEPISTNTDYKSQAQTDFCKNILRYVEKEKHLDKAFEKSTEIAIALGAAYVSREWDASLGEVYGVDPVTQTPQHKGDFVVNVYNWLDCIFDFAAGGYESTNWRILRKYVNRWDLVAKFPSYADQIKAMSIAPEVKRHRLGHLINEINDDLIPLYTFYHDRTPAVPNGRMAMFLDENICLFDGELPYKRVPVSRITADDQIDSPFAYTIGMDILPLQKVYNALCSVVCTNQAAFGVQNILIPREAAISLSQLSEGLNAIYYDPSVTQGAKPEALNLLMNKQEVFNWIEYLEKKMYQISGVNDTIQGKPEANLKSGTALAFMASQALTFISPLSRSYNQLIEDTWTGIIDILKEYATTPRMMLISGVSNKAEAIDFTSKDIEDIDRVIVEAGNPLLNTLAGRIQVAQDLVQAGLATKEEYLSVLTSGQLEPVYKFENSQMMRIKEENEKLQDGKPVKMMVSDNHPLDIREHLVLLNSPEVRNNPDPNNPIVVNTIQHIMEHLNAWSGMDARLGAIIGVPPAPPPPGMGMPGVPPPQPGQPPQHSAPPGKENPNGAKTPAAPNLPGAPKLPPGSPAINQEANARMAATGPQVPGISN